MRACALCGSWTPVGPAAPQKPFSPHTHTGPWWPPVPPRPAARLPPPADPIPAWQRMQTPQPRAGLRGRPCAGPSGGAPAAAVCASRRSVGLPKLCRAPPRAAPAPPPRARRAPRGRVTACVRARRGLLRGCGGGAGRPRAKRGTRYACVFTVMPSGATAAAGPRQPPPVTPATQAGVGACVPCPLGSSVAEVAVRRAIVARACAGPLPVVPRLCASVLPCARRSAPRAACPTPVEQARRRRPPGGWGVQGGEAPLTCRLGDTPRDRPQTPLTSPPLCRPPVPRRSPPPRRTPAHHVWAQRQRGSPRPACAGGGLPVREGRRNAGRSVCFFLCSPAGTAAPSPEPLKPPGLFPPLLPGPPPQPAVGAPRAP